MELCPPNGPHLHRLERSDGCSNRYGGSSLVDLARIDCSHFCQPYVLGNFIGHQLSPLGVEVHADPIARAYLSSCHQVAHGVYERTLHATLQMACPVADIGSFPRPRIWS